MGLEASNAIRDIGPPCSPYVSGSPNQRDGKHEAALETVIGEIEDRVKRRRGTV